MDDTFCEIPELIARHAFEHSRPIAYQNNLDYGLDSALGHFLEDLHPRRWPALRALSIAQAEHLEIDDDTNLR